MNGERQRRALIAAIHGPDPRSFTPRRLQEIADGPLMNPRDIFLPAGRLTMAETAQREARIMAGHSR